MKNSTLISYAMKEARHQPVMTTNYQLKIKKKKKQMQETDSTMFQVLNVLLVIIGY